MGIWYWLANNSFTFLKEAVEVAGVWFAGYAILEDAKARKVTNFLAIIASHRDVWKPFIYRPDLLARVRNPLADPIKQPVTDVERAFVISVILHMSGAFYAMRNQVMINVEGQRRDIAQFLSLPIPSAVWDKIKTLQNDDFVAFVESCRNWK